MIEGKIFILDCGTEDEIPLTNVSSKTLKKVIKQVHKIIISPVKKPINLNLKNNQAANK